MWAIHNLRVTFSTAPLNNISAKVSYRNKTSADVPGSYILVAQSATIQPDGLIQNISITGLQDGEIYVIRIEIPGCGFILKDFNSGTASTTIPFTTVQPTTTVAPTTLPVTTAAPTTLPVTTAAPTTLPATTIAPTTLPPATTTIPPTTTVAPTTIAPATTTAPAATTEDTTNIIFDMTQAQDLSIQYLHVNDINPEMTGGTDYPFQTDTHSFHTEFTGENLTIEIRYVATISGHRFRIVDSNGAAQCANTATGSNTVVSFSNVAINSTARLQIFGEDGTC